MAPTSDPATFSSDQNYGQPFTWCFVSLYVPILIHLLMTRGRLNFTEDIKLIIQKYSNCPWKGAIHKQTEEWFKSKISCLGWEWLNWVVLKATFQDVGGPIPVCRAKCLQICILWLLLGAVLNVQSWQLE